MPPFFPKTRWRSQSQCPETARTEVGKQVGKLFSRTKNTGMWLPIKLPKYLGLMMPSEEFFAKGEDIPAGTGFKHSLCETHLQEHCCHQLQLEMTSLQLFLDTDFRSQCWAGKWGMRAFPELTDSHFPLCRCRTLFLCCDYSGWHCTPTVHTVVIRCWRNTWDWRSCNHSFTKVIYGAAECQNLIHIPTSALHKHRSYQTILNQRSTYDHRFILKPQAHRTFIINSVFLGSSTIRPPLGRTTASPWYKQTQNVSATTRKNWQLKSLKSPKLEGKGCRNLICVHF